MFLLRCVFWLSLVYASILWPGSALRKLQAFGTGRSVIEQAKLAQPVLARAGLAVACGPDAAACLQVSARLGTLGREIGRR